jgi:hypothetical protein
MPFLRYCCSRPGSSPSNPSIMTFSTRPSTAFPLRLIRLMRNLMGQVRKKKKARKNVANRMRKDVMKANPAPGPI